MGSLFEYLKRETAVNALEKSVKHAQIVQKCVVQLEAGLKILLKEKNLEKAQELMVEVDELEDKADTMRREIQKDVSMGELNPNMRQNLSHLIKRMDDVANCCTGVARRISTLPTAFWEQSSNKTIDFILEIMENTVECSKFLDKMVIDLLKGRSQIKEFAKKINEYEHNVDLLYIKLLRSLQETEYSLNFFTVFYAGNIFIVLEAVSDAIEEVADYILVLLTSAEKL